MKDNLKIAELAAHLLTAHMRPKVRVVPSKTWQEIYREQYSEPFKLLGGRETTRTGRLEVFFETSEGWDSEGKVVRWFDNQIAKIRKLSTEPGPLDGESFARAIIRRHGHLDGALNMAVGVGLVTRGQALQISNAYKAAINETFDLGVQWYQKREGEK